ncbi:ABC transporter ATP-binding protein [Psychrobacillus sp. NPDC096389]|uniref:ABC transporter ATP-binding protein n=1 Tax=Psychrobacillus sp. NPDC096389 TaxID=3364490 RepID=UPI0038272CED
MQKTLTKDVEIRGVSKSYGSNQILKGIDLDIEQGELITLLGPSGCGKTTTLNVIAGFIEVDEGEVYIKGRKMNSIPPYKRDLGMVFQTYSLFPHLTIYENLEFGLNIRKMDKKEKNNDIKKMLELVRLTGLEDRYPRELSGGQRQRVAIARALVAKPQLLLLDEPLSNLDAKLKLELRAEIKRLQKEVGITTIFVTHDQEEALSMSDRIVVMNEGKIEQIGTPTEIYEKPQTEFVFQFIGKSNRFNGQIISMDVHTISVELEDGSLIYVNAENVMKKESTCQIGDNVVIYIRPEKIFIASHKDEQVVNSLNARISQVNFLGNCWEIEVDWNGKVIQLFCPTIKSDWIIGHEVRIAWKSNDLKLNHI